MKIGETILCSDQQHRVHFLHEIDDDIQELERISLSNAGEQTIKLLYDERDYLSGVYNEQNRLKYLVSQRNLTAPTAEIIIA